MENCSCKLNSKSTEQQEYVKSVDTPAWADNIESVGEPLFLNNFYTLTTVVIYH